tara:strand:- start:1669 stop:1872 length:204 start_codon:yes stop_codon:yes gene_type:complete
MDKNIIRATINIEIPFRHDYMNYNEMLNKKLKQVIADADFIPCKVIAGELEPCGGPILREVEHGKHS